MRFEMNVSVNRVAIVRPNVELTRGKIVLGLIDHHVWYIPYRSRIMFYDRPKGFDFGAFVENLRISLAKTLDLFYPFAGRMCCREDGILEVDCNGDGVLFIEASTDANVDQFQNSKTSVEGCAGLAQKHGHQTSWPWQSDTPLIIIQATEIRNEAISISFRYSHQICDGMSAWHFVKTWAEICRGQDVSLFPKIMYYLTANQLKSSRHLKSIKEIANNYKYSTEQANEHHQTLTRCFTFNSKVVQKLKERAQDDEFLSAFQLLSAHIWSKITEARQIADDQDTRLMFPVNCRERSIKFPKGYFGNGALMLSVVFCAGKLLSDPLLAAKQLKNTIHHFTNEKIDAILDLIAYGDLDHDTDNATSVRIGSSFKFPIYESDFGHGPPMDMTCLPEACDGTVYYFPGKERGSVDAHISLETTAMLRMISLKPTII